MKKILTKAGILFVVFLLGVMVFSSFMNKKTTDNKMDLEKATLPVLSMKIGDQKVNRMYGHAQEMQVDFMRDSLTPLGTDKELTVSIDSKGHKIENLIYEVRTSDGSKVIENDKIKNFNEEEDGEKTVSFSLQKSILMNQEYSLILTLNTEEGEWYYYTRILQRSGLRTENYIDFAQSFSNKTFNKENLGDLKVYLESDNSVSNNSFANVNIHSSADLVTWGSLEPSVMQTGIPTIKDINETTGSVSLTYFITAEDDEGNQEYYQVDEFYRMRYDGSRIRLLDFERSAKEIFTGNAASVASGKINLGITSKNVQYVTSQTGEIIAFAQQGDLWSYNTSVNKLTQIFSFRQFDDIEEPDERNAISLHDFKIIRVEENGDMDFVVYGYMNRGENEGYTGVAVYHYYNDENMLEEKIFLPSTKSYEFMEQDVQVLSYVSTDNLFYLMLQGKLYKIHMTEGNYEILKEGIENNCFLVSNSNKHVAWMEEMDPYASSNIVLMDLESGETTRITAEEGTKVRAFGFINEDLVYGIARDGDILTDASGTFCYAMKEVRIQNFEGEIVKSYAQDGVYLTDVDIQQGLIELKRAQWQTDHYAEITSDHIMNNVKSAEEAASVITVTTSRKGTTTGLVFAEDSRNKNPLMLISKYLVLEQIPVLDMSMKEEIEEAYYVYARGQLTEICENPGQAVRDADNLAGVVLNRAQQYIWERGNLRTKITLNMDDIPDCFKSASTDLSYLKENIGEEGTVLDFTGCSLDQVLYQLSAQRPVIVSLGEQGNRVIVGYDAYNTLLYNPADDTTSYMGLNDSRAAFEAAGNVFISYIEKLPD